jgi:APA family basic amino acid/polyamine antiporter
MLFAMSRRGDLPAAFEKVHPAHAVPHVGIAFTAGVIAVLAVVGTLEIVVAAAAFTILLYYAITNVAALRLDAAHHRFPRWVPALGLLSCLALAASLDLATILTGLALLAAGFVLRAVYRSLGMRSEAA